jgi:phage I-like protein
VKLSFSTTALPEADAVLPSEFRLLKFGANPFWKMDGSEGELYLDAESARQVMDRFAARGLDRIAIDLDHQIVNGGPTDTAGKAYGWFKPEVRADGLYAADVKWTPEGADLLRGKAYRFFSPTVETDGEGRAVDLLPVALTNIPALKGIPALVAANAKERPMKILLTSLGLGDDADEAKAVAAVDALKEAHTQILALSGKSNVAEAVGAITALKAQAERVETLSAEVAQLRAEKLASEINSLLDEAVKDGRVAPAKHGDMLALSQKHGVDALKACLSMLPKQPAQSAPAIAPVDDVKTTVQLTDDEKKIAQAVGLTHEAFAANKARLLAK